jgi:hypothetical protein
MEANYKNYYNLFIMNMNSVTLKGCADILTCDRTPQKVTIEPMMPYTNVDIFREKRVPMIYLAELQGSIRKFVPSKSLYIN